MHPYTHTARRLYEATFLGAFAELRKTTISFMPVRMEQLGSHCTDVHYL